MHNMKIGAVIVTYNPDKNILKQTLDLLRKEEIKIVVVDNNSDNVIEFKDAALNHAKLISEERNVGIAKALNDGIKWLGSEHVDWAVTLDQDTMLPEDYFIEFKKMEINPRVGAYYPQVVDRNEATYVNDRIKKRKDKILSENPNSLFLPIQSGAFISIGIFFEVGGFDESLFIDDVDFDYFLEIISIGKQLSELKTTKIFQTVGNKTEKNFLGYKFHPTNHAPIRYYYIFRNMPVVIKRHKQILVDGNSEMSSFFRANYKRVLRVLLGESQRLIKIKAMIKGYQDSKQLDVVRKKYV